MFPARLFFWSGPFEWLTAYLAPLCLAAFALSTAQVLLPYWFGRAPMPVWVDPYFVFAFVSLGAIVGTLTYPLAIEPWFTRREQALGVALVMTVLGVLWVISLVVLEMAGGATIASEQSPRARRADPGVSRRGRRHRPR